MSSMYNLIIDAYQMCSSSVCRIGSGVGGEEVDSYAAGVVRGLVERTPC